MEREEIGLEKEEEEEVEGDEEEEEEEEEENEKVNKLEEQVRGLKEQLQIAAKYGSSLLQQNAGLFFKNILFSYSPFLLFFFGTSKLFPKHLTH